MGVGGLALRLKGEDRDDGGRLKFIEDEHEEEDELISKEGFAL